MKTSFLCAAATALFGLVLAPGAAQAQTLVQSTSAPRAVRLFVEDMSHVPVPAVVYYRDAEGEMALSDPVPEGGYSLPNAADLQTILIKDPFALPTQVELDLRGMGSVALTVCIDGFGNSKIVSLRQFRQFSNKNVASPPNGIGLPSIPVFTPFGPLLGLSVSNDSCSTPTDIGSSAAFGYIYAPFLSTDGQDHPACNEFGDEGIDNDSWYLWTAPCTGTAALYNCGLALGDSKVAVYQGSATCTPGDLDLLACNDDACGPVGLDSFVYFGVAAGESYLFRVGRSPLASTSSGAGVFLIECIPAPQNDLCQDAISVPVNNSVFGTTEGATVDDDVAGTCPGPFFDVTVNSPGVWYSVIGTGGQLQASVCNSELDFLSKLTVYCGDCDSNLLCVGAVNNEICIGNPRVIWDSQVGVEYRVLVHGALGHFGEFRLDIDEIGPCIGKPVACGEPQIGACCTEYGCLVTTDVECALLNGLFGGDGTDCCGRGIYEYATVPGMFEDISLDGLQVFGSDSDDEQATLNLGFCFDFMQGVFLRLDASMNGVLSFDIGEFLSFSNDPIPDTDTPQHVIAPLWDDWVSSAQPDTGLYVARRGTPGNRRFIVQWQNVQPFGGGPLATFQAVLHEGSNRIVFCYPDLDDNYIASAMEPDITCGLENGTGTDGLAVPLSEVRFAAFEGACLRFERTQAFCDAGTVYINGVENIVYFSDLDGGSDDEDGVSNGVFTATNLEINDAQILVDVPSAVFQLGGTLVMTGQGRIDGETGPPQPDQGPQICVFACEGVSMEGASRITANGTHYGGTIFVCTDFGSVILRDRAYLQAIALHTSDPTWGGEIHVSAKQQVRLLHYLNFMAVHGREAGEIMVEACGGHANAIELVGRLQAIGDGLEGVGGEIFVRAHKGGAEIPAFARLRVEGGILGGSGQAYVEVATTVIPYSPPAGIAPTILVENSPSGATCRCDLLQDNAGPPVWMEEEE